MTDFLRIGMRVEQVPVFLSESVTGFKASVEYQELREYERENPGVICSAFAKYLCRIAQEQFAEGTDTPSISSAHAAMDAMAASPSTAVQSLLTDEVFENLDCDIAVVESIRRNLKPNAAELYTHWIARML
jgi:hypothetical protein